MKLSDLYGDRAPIATGPTSPAATGSAPAATPPVPPLTQPGPAPEPAPAPILPRGAPAELAGLTTGKAARAAEASGQDIPPPTLSKEERDATRAALLIAVEAIRPMSPKINADTVPFVPDTMGTPAVRERIAQGPYVYRSRAEKEAKDGLPPPVTQAPAARPTLAHPDTSKPGTFITGDSRPYRPGGPA